MYSSLCQTKFVGESEESRRVRNEIPKLARTDCPVLILGETGTGKEVVARSIYQAAPKGPFVTIDCSSFVGTLLESELFGHAKGAFTGAESNRPGLLAAADGGTAFFDEIGELPLEFQAKLLRALQFKEFRPVGAIASRRSDFRILAATNRDLAKEVERGTFRQDLYYRLNVMSLRLRPLRERPEDIEPLASYFLRLHSQAQSLHPDLVEVLREYPWPGNARELENCIRQMIVMSSKPVLELNDAPCWILEHGQASQLAPKMPAKREEGPVLRLEEAERNAILGALTHARGDRSAAARMLGIGRTTLYRKLKGLPSELALVG